MNEYSKTVGIKFEVKTDSLNKVKEAIKSIDALSTKEDLEKLVKGLKEASKAEGISSKEKKKLMSDARYWQRQLTRDKIQESMADFKEGMKGSREAFSWKKAGEEFASSIDKVLTKAKDALVDLLKDAWSELDNILQYSLLSNQNTRNLAFTYGFNASQAYGFDKAMGLMGLQSEEDIAYLNNAQREKFFTMMNSFSDKYSSLYDKGFFDQYLDFQYEMAEFKEDVKLEIVQFFMDNKDLIKSGMKAIMKLTEGTLKALAWIVDFFKGSTRDASERVAASTDIINNYANNTRTTDVKIDNTFNNVARQDQGWLVNAGMTVSEQIVRAFK